MKILQITDLHLHADPEKLHWDLNTTETFESVLSHGLIHENPSLILFTGDLSEDASSESYIRLRDNIEKIQKTSYLLAGNHDSWETMKTVFPDTWMPRIIPCGNWVIIMLDSVVNDAHHGELNSNELIFLETELKKYSNKFILIALHHNPTPVDSPILDKYGIQSPEAFINVIKLHKNVRLVLYGHVHQDFTRQIENITLLGTPSTCRQFSPKAETFTLNTLPPGYRWLDLQDNGSFSTGVRYL